MYVFAFKQNESHSIVIYLAIFYLLQSKNYDQF